MSRAFLLVLDSVGIGGAPDAAKYGDEGANTLGHIAQACAQGGGDKQGLRSGPLLLPNLESLGLGLAAQASSGILPPGFSANPRTAAVYANAREQSNGKDTPSGHWEIAGVPVRFDWGYFPRTHPAIPQQLLDELTARGGLPGTLGNIHASGTEIIRDLGEEHVATGKPILYTSADSVLQIAAHENHFGLERLYELCILARELVDDLNIGRVIARPFIGENADSFERTGNRRDYSMPPPEPTLLEIAREAGRQVIAIGKIDDIFAHRGPTDVWKANGNDELFKATMKAVAQARDGALTMANFIDFDQLHGHRRDVPGYAAALERFDALLPQLMNSMRGDDLLVLTADHGNDPTWRGTDHTREQVPVLMWRNSITPACGGSRESFADIGATVAQYLNLKGSPHGSPIEEALR